jgi:hypothetical protein
MAVADWVTPFVFIFQFLLISYKILGKDILQSTDIPHTSKGKQPIRGSVIQVTLMYEGDATTWDLSINTSTRTLYCLVYRATKARYSLFTIRLKTSKAVINDSERLTLGITELTDGGVIEISFAFPHRRRLYEVKIDQQVVLLPPDAPILALIAYLDPGSMSGIQLWFVL